MKAKTMLDMQHGKIDNVVGWLVSCIRNDYDVKSRKAVGKKNNFNDFPTKDIDFDALEKKIYKN